MSAVPARLPLSARAGAAVLAFFEGPWLFLLAILALLVAVPLWMAVSQVDQVVRVEGKIIPAGRSQQIQHLEGGIIASISTREGAKVRRGDLLLTIDDTAAGATLSEARIKLNSQRARAVRLEAEARDQSTLVFPPDLARLPVADAERQLFVARRAKLAEDIAVHQGAISQHSSAIEDASQRRSRLLAESETARKRLELEQGMAARGAASKMEVLEAQSREQRLRTEISDAEGAVPKLRASIAEEQARIETARAEASAQAHNDLVSTLEEIDRLRQTITSDADRMKRTEIRAPVDGVVNRITVNTVGGVVKPGEVLIELTPTTQGVLIEARANPRDRGYLHSGLESQIRVSAYDVAELGLLKGSVTEVGADSIVDSKGEPYYQVNVLVQEIPASYAGHPLIPGMTVSADIVTGRRTILAYLLSPIRKFTYAMFRDPR